jgi:LPS export ABC transporter protein LptC
MMLQTQIMTSCKNDIEYINALSNELNLPTETGTNFEVQYTDSCRLQVIFKAPLVERYTKGGEEGSYYEFTKGIEMQFFDRNEQLESVVTARYAKYWEDKNLGLARDSVVGRNVRTGEQLNTEELYWDREKKIIYSNVFTKITNDDGVYFGEKGFEADQGFQNYKLIGSSGSVNVENDENN